MSGPPSFAIEEAIEEARRSPCAKSKRGAVVFAEDRILGIGFNGQPTGFACTDSHACHKHCAMICMHAEARAILDALTSPPTYPRSVPRELVHVKVSDGKLATSGGPSCVQCSRLVVDQRIAGVWLYEVKSATSEGVDEGWYFYPAAEFHRISLDTNGIRP